MKNITIKEYCVLKNTVNYDSLLSNLLGKDSFCGSKYSLSKLSYDDVRKIEKLLKNGKTFQDLSVVFQTAFKVTDDQFWNAKIVDFFEARNFLKKEIERILLQEKSLLKSERFNPIAWDNAGGKKLEAVAHLIPLTKIGKIYNIYPFDLGKKPYNEIMALLVTHKRSDEVEEEYRKLTTPKNSKT